VSKEARTPTSLLISTSFPPAALWWLLGGALLIRLCFMPAPGWDLDVHRLGIWMRFAIENGVAHIGDHTWINYPPGYLYLLKAAGWLWMVVTGGPLPADDTIAMRYLVKLVPALADLAAALMLYLFAAPRLSREHALVVAAAYAYNPAMIFNSAVWGQADSLLSLLLLPAAGAITAGCFAVGFALATAACIVKFQSVVLLPVLLLAAWHRGASKAIFAGVRAAAVTAFVLFLPFYLAENMDTQVNLSLGSTALYPFVSMNAQNVWWLLYGLRSPDLSDAMRIGNAMLTYYIIGIIMLATATTLVLWRLWRELCTGKRDPLRVLLEAIALQVLAFYLFPTQMHERYVVPALLFLAALCVWSPRAWWLYATCSAAVLFSLASTLNRYYPANAAYPGLDWLALMFRADHKETFALSVVFLSLFVVLLLWLPDRRFRILAPVLAAVVAILVAAVAFVPLHGSEPLYEWRPVAQSQDWGALKQNHSVEDHRLTADGFLFRHGIGTHANSRLTYHLNNAFRALDTSFALDDESNRGQRVRFRILGDGTVRYDSGDISGVALPHHVIVPLAGVRFLTLEVLDGGDGINFDHADWLEPVLLR
jgi:Gpi18-like mannosyltransferase